jgi:Domain of unknown function (DUF4440)
VLHHPKRGEDLLVPEVSSPRPRRKTAESMRNRFLAAGVAVSMSAVALLGTAAEAPSRAEDTKEDRKTVAALDTEYQAAVKSNNAEVMDRMLADDFILVTGSGRAYRKADLLDEARSGR